MFKKIIAAILFVCTLVTVFASCDLFVSQEENDSETAEINGEAAESNGTAGYTFSTYEDILRSLHFMTAMYNDYKLANATREDFESSYDLSTDENREMYERLDGLVSAWYPPALGASSPAEDAFAYGIKDLDGDGVDDLVIIEGDRYRAVAVFTEINGKIVLEDASSLEQPQPSCQNSHKLAYWINTVGLDLKPMFAESDQFDLDVIRQKAIYEIERSGKGMPFSDVWVDSDQKFISLMDYAVSTPSGMKPLSEIENVKFAFVDMDGDTVDELVINCGEILILHYCHSSVYLCSLSSVYDLKTDGAFYWNDMGEDRVYGESRWNTDGHHATEQLWKIVNDGDPDAEYYIGDQEVTKAEMDKYLADDHIKTDVEFFTLEELWGDEMSPLEAIEKGREYWKNDLADEDDIDVVLRFRSHFYSEELGDAPNGVYILQLVSYDSHHNSTYIDEIWVDKRTGQINDPYGSKE